MALIMDRLLVLGKFKGQQQYYSLAAAAGLFVIVGLEIGEVTFDEYGKYFDPCRFYPTTCRIVQ